MQRAAARIIDANFNRAREGARMMEEFARFVLNNKPLSSRAKALRHRISAVVNRLDASSLLAARDSARDVGVHLQVQGQLKRGNLSDASSAAAKRLGEALRVLTETIQAIDPEIAAELESARFEAYALERDLAFAMNAHDKFASVRLYVLLDALEEREFCTMARAVIDGGADCVQLRAKDVSGEVFFVLACRLTEICREAGVVSIINDRPDIAVASGADGVHLGSGDVPAKVLRAIATRPMILGLTTHNASELACAIEQGADYVGIGPFANTPTKPELASSGIAYLKEALVALSGTGVYHTAIGGITTANISEVFGAGAMCAAVSSAVTKAASPRDAAAALKALCPQA
ncbi:MAG: thiamine phosphate synthase [Phycisphaerae bacterium]